MTHIFSKNIDRRVLFVLIAVEAVLFCNFFYREIAWYPPPNNDQTAFLTEAYKLEERTFSRGLGELRKAVWSRGHASGLLLPVEGAFAGLVLGGTRLPQLCILFIAFGALQIVAFSTARAVWDRRAYGYMVLGLILCQTTAWFWAGGLFDFRLDFVAYCLYGIWASAVLRSKLFLDRRWAIGCGLIGAFLVLHRFLTFVYLLGVCAGFALACIIIGLAGRGDTGLGNRLKQQLYNLALSLGILVLAVSPILIANRRAIHDYYVVGHITGQEKYFRASQAGVSDLASNLFYYPKSILNDHLGSTFLRASALAIATGLIAQLLSRYRSFNAQGASRRDELLPIVFLLGAIVGPITVLTVDLAKSPVVGGIVGVPAAFLIVALTAAVTPKFREREPWPIPQFVFSCSLVIFAMGLFNQLHHTARHLPEYAQRRDLESLVELNKWLVNYAHEHGWCNPLISFDVISGLLNSGTITTNGFEQTGQLIEFRPMLGTGFTGVDRQEALSLLANSDFVILTALQKTGVFPLYQHLTEYWGDLKAWADKNMLVARIIASDSFTATVYVQPTATILGISGDWVTSDGFLIEAPRSVLLQFPRIRLSGPANYSWLPKIPTVSARIETGSQTQAAPAFLQRDDNAYVILVDLSNMELPRSDPIRLHLDFDTFFVPKKIGVNGDTRQLVVNAPTIVRLIPR
jgi:hypothetical protein